MELLLYKLVRLNVDIQKTSYKFLTIIYWVLIVISKVVNEFVLIVFFNVENEIKLLKVFS
jgi:hypothetical protein